MFRARKTLLVPNLLQNFDVLNLLLEIYLRPLNEKDLHNCEL